MRKFLAISLLAFVLSGCGTGHASRQFYVVSTSSGYRVAVDSYSPNGTTWISKPFVSPIDADILAEKLNRDMEEDWVK